MKNNVECGWCDNRLLDENAHTASVPGGSVGPFCSLTCVSEWRFANFADDAQDGLDLSPELPPL